MSGPTVDDPPEAEVDRESSARAGALTDDALYSVVADRRRRNAIHYLKQREEPVSVGELAEQLAAWENDKAIDDLTSQERKRVYISLYQSHLPTLDNAGVVEYREGEGTVTLSDSARRRRIYLEVVPRNDIPWNLYYVGLTLAGAVLIALAWLEVYPFVAVPDLAWAAVLLVMFGLSAFVQTYTSRRRELGDAGPPPDYLTD